MANIKNGLFLLISLNLSIGSNAQQKNYSGIYDFGFGIKGTANYQYYENANQERVFNGNFTFNGHGNNQNTFNVVGHFKNGQKEGTWTASSYCSELHISGQRLKAHTITEKGSFVNGKKDGQWSLLNVAADNSNRNRLIAFFRQGRPVGNWAYEETEEKVKFQCQFNENGYLHGEWLYTYIVNQIPFEDHRKYKNGVMYFRLFRNLSNGEIIDRRDYSGFVDSFFRSFNVSANISYVDSIPYFLQYGGQRQVQGYDILLEQFKDLDDNLLFPADNKEKSYYYAEIEENSSLLENTRTGYEKPQVKAENTGGPAIPDTRNATADNKSLDTIFTKVDIEAQFPGDTTAWLRYLNKNLNYPDDAVNNEIQGTVIVQFIVDKEGNVSDIQAIAGPERGGLRQEAVRVIKKSGKWAPAMQNGRKVKSYKKQPILFKLRM